MMSCASWIAGLMSLPIFKRICVFKRQLDLNKAVKKKKLGTLPFNHKFMGINIITIIIIKSYHLINFTV